MQLKPRDFFFFIKEEKMEKTKAKTKARKEVNVELFIVEKKK